MTAPTNAYSKPFDHARAALAATAAWQSWVNAANATAAAARVHDFGYPTPPNDGREYTHEELRAFRPCVILDYGLGGGAHDRSAIAASGGAYEYEDRGALLVTFEDDVPEELTSNHGELMRRFLNRFGDVIEQWCVLTSNGLYLVPERVSMEVPPMRMSTEEEESYDRLVTCSVRVEWGSTA